MMKKFKFYLIYEKNGTVSVRKKHPDLPAESVGVKMEVDIPEEMFEHHFPKTHIELTPESAMVPIVRVQMEHKLENL